MWWKKLKFSDKSQFILVIITLVSVIITFFSVMDANHANEKILEFSNKSIDLSKKSIDLSKQTLCLQKDVEYRNIAPPSIVVYLKEQPIIKNNRTASMTFRFHLIPNSKTFLYPDADLDITNFRGFLDNSGVYFLDNSGYINNSISIITVQGGFPYPPWDYRNESTMDITYDIVADVSSEINFKLYPQKKPINVPMNFTFKLKDVYDDKYNDTVFYNITIGEGNIESIIQPKVFDFKRPENYRC